MRINRLTRSRRWNIAVLMLIVALCVVAYFVFFNDPEGAQSGLPIEQKHVSPIENSAGAAQEKISALERNSATPATTLALDEKYCQDPDHNSREPDTRLTEDSLPLSFSKNDTAGIQQFLANATGLSNDQKNAIALFLRSTLLSEVAQRDYDSAHKECAGDLNSCAQKSYEARKQGGLADANELAKFAIYSSDAKLYALAFHACGWDASSSNGYCRQISAEQWAYRDPENAAAWLYVITRATTGPSKSQNEKSIESAYFQLSQSKRFDLGLSQLSSAISSAQERTGIDNVAVKVAYLNVSAATSLALPSYSQILDFCAPSAVKDANRRQICDGVANRLLGPDTTLIDTGIGLKIARNLGWEAEKIRPFQDERDASFQLQIELQNRYQTALNVDATTRASCLAMIRMLKTYLSLNQFGEKQASLQEIKRQNFNAKELAERYRAATTAQAPKK